MQSRLSFSRKTADTRQQVVGRPSKERCIHEAAHHLFGCRGMLVSSDPCLRIRMLNFRQPAIGSLDFGRRYIRTQP